MNAKPRLALDLIENLGVERLARKGGVLDEAEVVLCQIFFNQESVNGCWRAEGARSNRWVASNMPCGVNFSVSYAPMQAPQIH